VIGKLGAVIRLYLLDGEWKGFLEAILKIHGIFRRVFVVGVNKAIRVHSSMAVH